MTDRPDVIRAVELSAAATLGTTDASDLGTTAGNGFFTRWADDLALLGEHDAGAIRLTVDWARLQPRPGALEQSWVEFYDAVLRAAGAIDLPVWLCLHERAIPKWFDNEGGFTDDTSAGRWWPRYAEAVADHLGDHAAGWIPFATSPVNRASVWGPTWTALRGGPPVAATFALPGGRDELRPDDDTFDVVALHIRLPGDVERNLGPDDAESAVEQLGTSIRAAAEDGPTRPIALGWLEVAVTDPDLHARVLQLARGAIDDAVADGVDVRWAFASPGISSGDEPALFTSDREPTASAAAWLGAD